MGERGGTLAAFCPLAPSPHPRFALTSFYLYSVCSPFDRWRALVLLYVSFLSVGVFRCLRTTGCGLHSFSAFSLLFSGVCSKCHGETPPRFPQKTPHCGVFWLPLPATWCHKAWGMLWSSVNTFLTLFWHTRKRLKKLFTTSRERKRSPSL